MERLRAWIYGHNRSTDNNAEGEMRETEAKVESHTVLQKNNISSPHHDAHPPEVVIDPKVAEYFKLFPEPYREKVVQRYSKREGIYKWDFFRDLAMANEMHQAMRGVFLEDKREFEELQREKFELEWENEQAEKKRLFLEREIPPWEKKVLEFVPLQPGDSMKLKLFQTVNLVALGMAFIWMGLSYKRSNPYPRWKVYSTLTGTFGTCGCCQVAAASRLMDLGPFDRSVDDRDLIKKGKDDFKEAFNIIRLYLDDAFRKP